MVVLHFIKDAIRVAVGASAFVFFAVAILVISTCRWLISDDDDKPV